MKLSCSMSWDESLHHLHPLSLESITSLCLHPTAVAETFPAQCTCLESAGTLVTSLSSHISSLKLRD